MILYSSECCMQCRVLLKGLCAVMFAQPGFEDGSSLQTPIVRYAAVSSIENSHLSPVTDLQWIPDHMEVSEIFRLFRSADSFILRIPTFTRYGEV